MTISIGGGMQNFAYPAGYTGPARSKPTGEGQGTSGFSRALDDLMAEGAKTPAERAREVILKRHGLDDKAYGALGADARKAIEAEIADAVKRTVGTRDRVEPSFMRIA
jgi:hypothetical protein